MGTANFFEKQTPESRVKTDIVFTHFAAWLNIIGSSTQRQPTKLAYMELFAGPGLFEDGNKSTPIRVVEHVVQSPFANRVQIVLNEMEEAYADALHRNVTSIEGFEKLGCQPRFLREEVTGANYQTFLREIEGMPAVLFVDPWGYKGVCLDLFADFISGARIGRDAILFFNYRRITAALSNEQLVDHMRRMFGASRAESLSSSVEGVHGLEREAKVFSAIEEALTGIGAPYLQRFEFSRRGDNLIFISKHPKGLEVAKEIMADRSDMDEEGVATFSFDPRPKIDDGQASLAFMRPPSKLQLLRQELLGVFAGRTLTFREVVREHNPGTVYVSANYREVLLQMENDGEIRTYPSSRRKGTFAPEVVITFPGRV